MEFWPSDDRNRDVGTIHKRKQKGKSAGAPDGNYHSVEIGSFGAVTLVEKNGRFNWTSVVNSTSDESSKRYYVGKRISVFPATRSPPLHIPRSTDLQRAERSANFIRTYLPDVDINGELLREYIAKDTAYSRELAIFDPHVRNILEVIHKREETSGTMKGFLAFAMGETNQELNLSPFHCTRTEGLVIRPSTVASKTLRTPIQQIISSKHAGQQGEYIAIRTFGSTAICQFKEYTANTEALVTQLPDIETMDVGNKAILDVNLFVRPFQALVVNEHGSVYTSRFANGEKTMDLHYSNADSSLDQRPFWRISRGATHLDCFLLSGKDVKRLDLRENNTTGSFLVGTDEIFTAIEDLQEDNIIRLCSTKQIIWLDPRNLGKPLLGVKHGRQHDRYLKTQTVQFERPLTFLTSRRNGLVTVYDVSRSDDHLVHVNANPYCLNPFWGVNESHSGEAFLPYSSDANKGIALLRVSELTGVHCLDLSLSESWETTIDIKKSPNLHELEVKASKLRPDAGPLGSQDAIEIDISPIYDNIFRVHEKEVEIAEIANAEAVSELVDNLPSFWHSSNEPVEHMLTTYDLAFRAGEEPVKASRADFLTGSIINSTKGYHALMQGRLSSTQLKGNTSWHRNIGDTLKCLDEGFESDPKILLENLRQYDLGDSPKRSMRSVKREARAREQLVLDLALSSDVYSSTPFKKPTDGNRVLETMTEALSLHGEPPPVNFGFLRPIFKENLYRQENGEETESMPPMGVRLLLKDWEVGADPEEFRYLDPYDATSNEQTTQKMKLKTPQMATDVTINHDAFSSQAQRPPAIIPSRTILTPVPSYDLRNIPYAQSQGFSRPSSQPQGYFSQDGMASTQILPGVYGGKKKTVKKRVDGF